VEPFKGLHSKGRLLIMLANIRLRWTDSVKHSSLFRSLPEWSLLQDTTLMVRSLACLETLD
jgi:hypothetical protein